MPSFRDFDTVRRGLKARGGLFRKTGWALAALGFVAVTWGQDPQPAQPTTAPPATQPTVQPGGVRVLPDTAQRRARGPRPFIEPMMSPHDPTKEVDLGDGLKIVDVKPGDGPTIVEGSYLAMHFHVFSPDGTFIDSSTKPGRSIAGVKVPGGEMFPAWEKALLGMKQGGRRKAIIPRHLGPGPEGLGPIPGEQDLVIEVEMVAVGPPANPATAHKDDSGSLWVDLVPGEGATFEPGAFATCHLTVWDDNARIKGSTRANNTTMQVDSKSDRYWVPYTLGMKAGGVRVVELDEPANVRQARLQREQMIKERERRLNQANPPAENGKNAEGGTKAEEPPAAPEEQETEAAQGPIPRWRMLIEIESVTSPIVQTPHDPAKEIDLGDGIRMVDLVVGDGKPLPADWITEEGNTNWVPIIHYSSWTEGGELLDSSYKPGQYKVNYSPGLYPGVWAKALTGMQVGGKRKLIVPANTGDENDFNNPPTQAMTYEIELLDFEEQIFKVDWSTPEEAEAAAEEEAERKKSEDPSSGG